MFTSLDYWLDAMFSCCLDFTFTLFYFGFTIGFYALDYVSVYEKLVCQVQQLDITTLILVSMSPLGGPRHKGDTVTGRSSGTHIYSEVAPFLYLAINSVFHLILVPSFPRFAACRCAFPASSATSSVTVTWKCEPGCKKV